MPNVAKRQNADNARQASNESPLRHTGKPPIAKRISRSRHHGEKRRARQAPRYIAGAMIPNVSRMPSLRDTFSLSREQQLAG